MTKKEERYILNQLFKTGIDANSSNCYASLLRFLNICPIETHTLTFKLGTLKEVLEKLSDKWDKEIDKIIE